MCETNMSFQLLHCSKLRILTYVHCRHISTVVVSARKEPSNKYEIYSTCDNTEFIRCNPSILCLVFLSVIAQLLHFKDFFRS